MTRRAAMVVVYSLTVAGMAQAQALSHQIFVGIGIGVQTNDAAQRTRLATSPQMRPLPRAEVGFRIRPTFGVQVAATRLQAITGETPHCGFATTCTGLVEREQETVLAGLLSARLVSFTEVAVDIVGGAGPLIQHAATTVTRCTAGDFVARTSPGSCVDTPASTFRISPAFISGVDAPVRLGRHAEVAPTFRVMALRRGMLDTAAELRRPSFKAEFALVLRGF